jgi:hypothetical protein
MLDEGSQPLGVRRDPAGEELFFTEGRDPAWRTRILAMLSAYTGQPLRAEEIPALVDGYRLRPRGRAPALDEQELRRRFRDWEQALRSAALAAVRTSFTDHATDPARRKQVLSRLLDGDMSTVLAAAERHVRSTLLDLYLIIAAIMERRIGIFPFDVQLAAAVALFDGDAVNVKAAGERPPPPSKDKPLPGAALQLGTGEGKTYVIPFAAVAGALTLRAARHAQAEERRRVLRDLALEHAAGDLTAPRSRSIHVYTANDYLVRRDCMRLRPIYEWFGLSASFIQTQDTEQDRAVAHAADIVYGTAPAFAWDYLAQYTASHRQGGGHAAPDMAIIDELDYVLIDAGTHSYIQADSTPRSYEECTSIFQSFHFLNQVAQRPMLVEWDAASEVLRLAGGGRAFLAGNLEPWQDDLLRGLYQIPSLPTFVLAMAGEWSVSTEQLQGLAADLAAELAAILPRSARLLFELCTDLAALVVSSFESTPSWVGASTPPKAEEIEKSLRDHFLRWLEKQLEQGFSDRALEALQVLVEALQSGPETHSSAVVDALLDLFDELVVQSLSLGENCARLGCRPEEVLDRFRQAGRLLDQPIPHTISTWVRAQYKRLWSVDDSGCPRLTEEGRSLARSVAERLEHLPASETHPTASQGENFEFLGQHMGRMLLTTIAKTLERLVREHDVSAQSQETEDAPARANGAPAQDTDPPTPTDSKAAGVRAVVERFLKALQHQIATLTSTSGFTSAEVEANRREYEAATAELHRVGLMSPEQEREHEQIAVQLQNLSQVALFQREVHLLQHEWDFADHSPLWLLQRQEQLMARCIGRCIDTLLEVQSTWGSHEIAVLVQIYLGYQLWSSALSGEAYAALASDDLSALDAPPPEELSRYLGNITALGRTLFAEPDAKFVVSFGNELRELRKRWSELLSAGEAGEESSELTWAISVLPGLYLRPRPLSRSQEFHDWAADALLGHLDRACQRGLIDGVGMPRELRLTLRDAERAMLDHKVGEGYLLAPASDEATYDPYHGRPNPQQVVLVDDQTGRTQPNSRYWRQIHGFIEAKHNLMVQPENPTSREITLRNLIQRWYRRVSGLSATLHDRPRQALTDLPRSGAPRGCEKLFAMLYGAPGPDAVLPARQPVEESSDSPVLRELRSIHPTLARDLYVPPNRERCLEDRWPDLICQNQEQQYTLVAALAYSLAAVGRPVLIQAPSIRASRELHAFLEQKLEHSVALLNGESSQEAREAEMIKQAGTAGHVLVATQMAGRGVDIVLDAEARAAGGLCVIGTHHWPSARADRQLMGRAGRQGDPGDALFVIVDHAIVDALAHLKETSQEAEKAAAEPGKAEARQAVPAKPPETEAGGKEDGADAPFMSFTDFQEVARTMSQQKANCDPEVHLYQHQRHNEEASRRWRLLESESDALEWVMKDRIYRLRERSLDSTWLCPCCGELPISTDGPARSVVAELLRRARPAPAAPVQDGSDEPTLVCRRCAACIRAFHRGGGVSCLLSDCHESNVPRFFVRNPEGAGPPCVHSAVVARWLRSRNPSVLRPHLVSELRKLLRFLDQLGAKGVLRGLLEAHRVSFSTGELIDVEGLSSVLRTFAGVSLPRDLVSRALRRAHLARTAYSALQVAEEAIIEKLPGLRQIDLAAVATRLFGRAPAPGRSLVSLHQALLEDLEQAVYRLRRSHGCPVLDDTTHASAVRARFWEDYQVLEAVDRCWPDFYRRLRLVHQNATTEGVPTDMYLGEMKRGLREAARGFTAQLRGLLFSRLFLPVRFGAALRAGQAGAHSSLLRELLVESGTWDSASCEALPRALEVALPAGVPAEEAVEALLDLGCEFHPRPLPAQELLLYGLADAAWRSAPVRSAS